MVETFPGAAMSERFFRTADGRTWRIRVRPESRRGEADVLVALELESDGEHRVVTCTKEEWEREPPDFAALVARSLPSGASRSIAEDHDGRRAPP